MCEGLDKDTLNILEKKILEVHPNTYTFTKKLAEQIILDKGKGLPIAIVRPSIIGAAEKEPVPGWVDNAFGMTGIYVKKQKKMLITLLTLHGKYYITKCFSYADGNQHRQRQIIHSQ